MKKQKETTINKDLKTALAELLSGRDAHGMSGEPLSGRDARGMSGEPLSGRDAREISVDMIRNVALFDLSDEGTYVKGCVFLTDTYLGIVSGPEEPLPEGQGRKRGNAPEVIGGPAQGLPSRIDRISFIELKSIDDVRAERLFASSLLTAVVAGKDTFVAAFTGSHTPEMNTFIKEVKAVLGGAAGGRKAEEDNETPDGRRPGKDTGDANIKGEGAEENQKKDVKSETGTEDAAPVTKKRTIFSRVFRYFLKYRISVVVLFCTYLASALISIIWPYLSGKVLYDGVIGKNDEFLADFGLEGEYMLALLVLVICMFGARVLQHGVQILQQYLVARVAAKTVRDIKQDIFSSMGDLSLRFFTSKQTGGLMTRVRSDADRIIDFFLDGFPFLFIHSTTIIVTFIVMFRLNWQLSLLAVVLLPVLVILSVKLKPALWTLYGKRHRAERSMTSKVNDNLTGARVVKAFGREDEEATSFSKKSGSLETAEVDIVRYNNRFTILYNMVSEISNIWVWIVGVLLVIETKSIDLGVLVTFVGYIGSLNGPMNFFSYIFRVWTDSINSAQRMLEIIDAVPDIREAADPVHLAEPRGEIELEHVTFGYEAFRPVLKDVSLHVHPGEVLGIVGRSGAGKSTLVNLISRLYDTDEGTIKIDGHDVRDLAFKDLRRSVAMVSQDTYIFMGSVADNIAYADKEVSRDDIIRAAKLAGAHDFISAMPDGYDTIVGAGGKDLSGGERQRLSIARAVLADPKILILDEATSAVDTKTEQLIERSVSLLAEGRTTISIAHRLSTLKNADRLIVIDGGQIVEEGTHDELMEKEGIYHMLSNLQTGFLSLEDI